MMSLDSSSRISGQSKKAPLNEWDWEGINQGFQAVFNSEEKLSASGVL